MITFKITCSQKLDDGDTALVEEYQSDSLPDINDIISQYANRSADKSYVDSFTVKVEINR